MSGADRGAAIVTVASAWVLTSTPACGCAVTDHLAGGLRNNRGGGGALSLVHKVIAPMATKTLATITADTHRVPLAARMLSVFIC
jgi:hypothetical protein